MPKIPLFAASFLLALSPSFARADDKVVPVNFTRDVVPLLTKLGCNSGACHGSFGGRGGFRLSLLGFDPLADFDALTREARGRRVFPASPDNSLLLLKPIMAVPHGGKKRLTAGSESYRIIREWIAQGLPGPGTEAIQVKRLEVVPNEAVLTAGAGKPLVVRAFWSDGKVQDATSLALYESTSDQVADVAADGKITGRKPGLTAITIRYMGQVAAVPVTIPYAAAGEKFVGPQNNFIDHHIGEEWQKLGLKPSPLASDNEFLRRVSLDLIGTLPSPEEIRKFVADKAPNKRALLIDALLERPEYADYWALKWGDLLRTQRKALGLKGLGSFNSWLKQSLRENRGVDRMTRELLTARGNLYSNGPAAYFFVEKAPEDIGETTSQVFLGIRLACAKCHHHPMEVWSQDDYYGIAAFFTGVQRKDTLDNGAFGGAQSIRLRGNGGIVNPRTQRVVRPTPLGQAAVPETVADPRVVLADWITAKDNPFFARNFANRFWGYLFGRGLVEPIDDMRATNPASHPELLNALARDLIEHNFDIKHLLRALANSRTYQLACDLAPEQDREGRFFTCQRPRRMPSEVLLDAINQAAGTGDDFDQMPVGTRAISLPDPLVVSYFLDTFGRPMRTSSCECERASRPDLRQALHLANSEAIHQKVINPAGRLGRLLAKANRPDDAIVEDLYLATFSRVPTDKEKALVKELLAKAPSRKEGLEDLLWALLNSSEFLFNH